MFPVSLKFLKVLLVCFVYYLLSELMVISQLSEILKGGIIFHCTYIPFSLREDDDTV